MDLNRRVFLASIGGGFSMISRADTGESGFAPSFNASATLPMSSVAKLRVGCYIRFEGASIPMAYEEIVTAPTSNLWCTFERKATGKAVAIEFEFRGTDGHEYQVRTGPGEYVTLNGVEGVEYVVESLGVRHGIQNTSHQLTVSD